MAEVAGKDYTIKISGTATTMTNEATTTTDDKTYQITNTAKRVIDNTSTLTVKDDGVTVTGYTVNYLQGTVTFDTADETRIITITGKYFPMTVAAYANEASTSKAVDLLEVTPFNTDYKKRIAGLKSASGTLSQFDITDETYIDALGEKVVIEDDYHRFWALLESTELAAAVEGVQGETVSWVSYDEWLKLGG